MEIQDVDLEVEIPTQEAGSYELAPSISMYDESASKLAFEREQ